MPGTYLLHYVNQSMSRTLNNTKKNILDTDIFTAIENVAGTFLQRSKMLNVISVTCE